MEGVTRIEFLIVHASQDGSSNPEAEGVVPNDTPSVHEETAGSDAHVSVSAPAPIALPEGRADKVLTDVLSQFARNFLLNDLALEQSFKLLEGAPSDIEFVLPRREPRRRDSTVEQVRQARMSVRRLRSTLHTFSDLFAAEWSNPVLSELSWYAAVLGEMRDLDVLSSSIGKSQWLIDDPAIQSLVTARLEHQIAEAQDRITVEKTTKRYACLVSDVATISSSADFLSEADGPALSVLSEEVRTTWRGLRKSRKIADDDASVEHLHRVRINLKRLQCACEIVGMVAGKPALKVARAAESNQRRLGVVHDESVAGVWLRALVVAEPDLKRPLREIIDFHDEGRRDAKRGWRDALASVDRSWDNWDI
jgi:CHAD domain-containing protein